MTTLEILISKASYIHGPSASLEKLIAHIRVVAATEFALPVPKPIVGAPGETWVMAWWPKSLTDSKWLKSIRGASTDDCWRVSNSSEESDTRYGPPTHFLPMPADVVAMEREMTTENCYSQCRACRQSVWDGFTCGCGLVWKVPST